jgi:methionyl-tRNA formyltransferase
MRLVSRMDAGPILLQERLPISDSDDYVSLEPRLAELGASLLVRALAERPPERDQDEAQATYTRKIAREDAHIDWTSSAESIWRQVRAYRGWPQAFTFFDGKLLKVLRATPTLAAGPGSPGLVIAQREPDQPSRGSGTLLVRCGTGALGLDDVQLEGKRPQTGAEFLRGYPGIVGAQLT